ncbi:MAG: nitroreductase family deazaflavin-dependent oxidoreductase [Chloroflexota bacterium]|nr:nitroreductase family deazaflavin-dependent oxidoreductase [Chloroflexota bacterium]
MIDTVVQKVVLSRPGVWLYSRLAHHLDRLVYRLTGGRATLASMTTGVPIGLVTTTGAKSGLSRTVPLLRVPDDQDPRRFALIASNWGQERHPAWYFNLKANPHATCSIRGQEQEYVAHEASSEEYERFWQRAVDIYPWYKVYRERASERRIPIMIMTVADS